MNAKYVDIKELSESELEDVLILEKDLFEEPWSREIFAKELSSETAKYFTLYSDSELVGYAGFNVIDGTAHLNTIGIKKTHQNNGLGSRLLDYIIKRSIERGCKEVFLEVRFSNKMARKLYTSFGFVPVGVRKNYYSNPTEDALIMILDLKV
jgi:ribosomal-protein-alanine N-acetyltransferase